MLTWLHIESWSSTIEITSSFSVDRAISEESGVDETVVLYYYLRRKRRIAIRRFWAQPNLEKHFQTRSFVASKQLDLTDARF